MKAASCFLLATIALSACGKSEPPRRKLSEAEMAAQAERKLAAVPAPREYDVNGHQLIVLQIPVQGYGSTVDFQRCFVWRDKQFQTASMQCEQPPELDLSDLSNY